MPPATAPIRLRPVTLQLSFLCPRCRRSISATTTHVATSAGDRAVLADELQAQLNLRIDAHHESCNTRSAGVMA